MKSNGQQQQNLLNFKYLLKLMTIKINKPYNRLLRKRRFTWMERKITRHTLRVAIFTELFWHKWALIHYGYSKRKMDKPGI